MTEANDSEQILAALELGYLTQSQVDEIEKERSESNYPFVEIAIRQGLLTQQQLNILHVFANPTDVVPGYRVVGLLGAGGVGTVFKATQVRMDRPVAIKTINRSSTRNDLKPKRFEREARIVGQLQHPNIISAIDFGIHNEQLYLVMEFVDGIDAERYLTDKKYIPEIDAWYIALQVCHALDNANKFGIIHRDIKPGNLILTEAPNGASIPANAPFVKIADFGLAKFKETRLDSTITMEHSISGTPYYMSPEQVKAIDIDHRSDIYSLGMTIWHLIDGCPPVFGTSPLDVITSKMKLEDSWMDDDPERISEPGFRLLSKMCRHDPDHRISCYTDLGAEIEATIEELERDSDEVAREFALTGDAFSVTAEVTTINGLSATFLDAGAVATGKMNANVNSETTDFRVVDPKLVSPERNSPVQSSALTHRNPALSITGMIALGSLILLGGGYFAWSQWSGGEGGANNPGLINGPRTQLVDVAGPPIFLFNGLDVDPTQRRTGWWEPDEDGDGGSVLAGKNNGTLDFRCVDRDQNGLSHFRFECGFRHNDVEQVAFRVIRSDGQKLFEVNISKTQIELSKSDVPVASHLLAQLEEDTFGYHRCRIESQPGYWRIEVDKQLIGEVAKEKETARFEPPTIQLAVEGKGTAHFGDIRFQVFR